METAEIRTTQESLSVEITNEDTSSISRVFVTLNLFHKASQRSLLRGNMEAVM